ncbi:MAG TPA: hypothetical protein VJL60_03350 [Gammaproteobacteria bacterium]|nr:hypothetical protein [Gammaproteobacteria bacterium]
MVTTQPFLNRARIAEKVLPSSTARILFALAPTLDNFDAMSPKIGNNKMTFDTIQKRCTWLWSQIAPVSEVLSNLPDLNARKTKNESDIRQRKNIGVTRDTEQVLDNALLQLSNLKPELDKLISMRTKLESDFNALEKTTPQKLVSLFTTIMNAPTPEAMAQSQPIRNEFQQQDIKLSQLNAELTRYRTQQEMILRILTAVESTTASLPTGHTPLGANNVIRFDDQFGRS